jgi:hypothetical protein
MQFRKIIKEPITLALSPKSVILKKIRGNDIQIDIDFAALQEHRYTTKTKYRMYYPRRGGPKPCEQAHFIK